MQNCTSNGWNRFLYTIEQHCFIRCAGFRAYEKIIDVTSLIYTKSHIAGSAGPISVFTKRGRARVCVATTARSDTTDADVSTDKYLFDSLVNVKTLKKAQCLAKWFNPDRNGAAPLNNLQIQGSGHDYIFLLQPEQIVSNLPVSSTKNDYASGNGIFRPVIDRELCLFLM